MAFVGMVIMQRSRPGNCCLESLFKALHHLSCQLLHVQVAFDVLFDRVGTQFETIEKPPLSPLFINSPPYTFFLLKDDMELNRNR